MKGTFWSIHVGDNKIQIDTDGVVIDAVEACTLAIESLHKNRIDYSIRPFTLAECENGRVNVKSEIALANAGKHAQCEKLRGLIAAYNNKMKSKIK